MEIMHECTLPAGLFDPTPPTLWWSATPEPKPVVGDLSGYAIKFNADWDSRAADAALADLITEVRKNGHRPKG